MGERGDLVIDSAVEVGEVVADLVDTGEHLGEQEGVVVAEAAGEGLFEVGELSAHPSTSELREGLGVTFSGDQRSQHVAARDPEDVGGYDAELDLGVFEQLLHSLLLRGPHRDQVGPVTGQVPQQPDLRRRDEAGPQHLPFGDLAQPHRVQPVGLGPPRQVLDVLGADQPRLEACGFQQVERGLPIVAGRLHDDPGDAQFLKPVDHAQQRPGHRLVGRDLLHASALPRTAGDPHATDQLGLTDVEGGDPLDDLLTFLGVSQHWRPPPGIRFEQGPDRPREPLGKGGI